MPSVRVLEPARATFSLSVIGIAMPATPTDVWQMKGATGKIIQLRRLLISGLSTTAGQMVASLVKRTADNTGGTSTVPVGVQADNDGVAAATFKQYTANPSGLGAGTVLRSRRIFLNLAAAAVPDRVEWVFGRDGAKTPRLNGPLEFFCVNMNGGALPAGGVLDVEAEWTEQ